MNRKILLLFFCLILLSIPDVCFGEALNIEIDNIIKYLKEQEVLQKYSAKSQLILFEDNKIESEDSFEMFFSLDESLALWVSPPLNKGKIILQKGKSYFLFFPKANNYIRISATSMLRGGVSYSDLLKLPLLKYYDFNNYETIQNKNEYKLIFILKKGITDVSIYKKIVHFNIVDKQITKVESFAQSGIMLGESINMEFENIQGIQFPVVTKVINLFDKNKYALIKMSKVTSIDVPNELFNPSNTIYQLPSRILILNANHQFSINNKTFGLDGNFDTYFQHRRIENTDSNKIYGVIKKIKLSYYVSDFFILSAGRDNVKFDNSQNEDILTIRSINKPNNPGYWSLGGHYYKKALGLSYYLIPKYDIDFNSEYRDKSDNWSSQFVISSYFKGIDYKVILFNNFKKDSPLYLAASLSYSLPFYERIILFVDTKIINKDFRYHIKDAGYGNYSIEQKLEEKLFNPILAGMSISISDKMDLGLEFLHDRYGFSKDEKKFIFEAAEKSQYFPSQFAQINRVNILSQNYLDISYSWREMLDKTNLFLYWKLSGDDLSSIARSNISYEFNKNLIFDLGYNRKLTNNKKTEFGNYYYDNGYIANVTYKYSF